jgi:AcrR family transcriptional regulator
MVQVKNERRSNKFLPEGPRPATAARHDDLRRDLLEAAERFIEANGLAELRARSLAQSVGCSVGAIYNVFPDLDSLILAVNARTLEGINDAMGAICAPTPHQQFTALAAAYLDYANTNRRRWDALFDHRLPKDVEAPDWFLNLQSAAFSHIEAPLAQLRPDLANPQLSLLARSIFAAVHGIAAFGLEHRTGPIDLPCLAAQLQTIALAMAVGLEKQSQGALPPGPPPRPEALEPHPGL